MKSDPRQKEVIRGKILQYLALIYPRAATLALLQGELDIFGFSLPMEELNFHVAYLAEKKLAAVESPTGPYSHQKIPLVKITAQGIDCLDGRLPAEEGIYLEPQP
jgi:hypothetical protein